MNRMLLTTLLALALMPAASAMATPEPAASDRTLVLSLYNTADAQAPRLVRTVEMDMAGGRAVALSKQTRSYTAECLETNGAVAEKNQRTLETGIEVTAFSAGPNAPVALIIELSTATERTATGEKGCTGELANLSVYQSRQSFRLGANEERTFAVSTPLAQNSYEYRFSWR